MLNNETDSFMNRVRRALTLPIRARCAELTVLFDRGSTLDLQNFFPLLIDNIFGPQGTVSWGLRVARDVNEDFRQLEHFLSPCGPVFKLIYTLLKDPSAKYDFPVMYLPVKVQQILENAQLHPFYADIVHVNPQTKHVISLLLNPFDYYMFHFAYHLINPWHQRSGSVLTTQQQASWNTVYYVLCCDYMLHFLPTTPGATVLPAIYYNGKNPIQPLQQMKSPVGSKLLNSSLLNKSVEEYSFPQNLGRHPRNQIWRSETVLTVFIDMWLNNDQISQPTNQINSSFNSSPVPRLLQYTELPTSEYMRIIRVLIKQLHAFSASAKIDDTHMCELKKIAIPMVEGKFYIFLRNLIHRWPLDGSFRLLLELWLTYIQPWRYPPDATQADLKKQNLDAEDAMTTAPPTVGREYLPFIAENLLIYVVIFQQLLPRFTRVDLVSPKMSVMLYRISKVFNQPNLASLLKEIEQSIENNHSPSHSYSSHWLSNLPPLNPTSNWCTNTSLNSSNIWPINTSMISETGFNSPRGSNFTTDANSSTFMNSLLGDKKWSAIVKQRIYELEGPSFCYKPLFSVPPAPEVYELVIQIKRSISVAQELVQIRKQEEQEHSVSFFDFLRIFYDTPTTTDEFSLNERLKVPEYLDKSLDHLKQLFQLSEVPESEPDTSVLTNSGSSGLEISNDFKFLTPERVRERMKKIKYEGDPDLHPIRTMEIAFLVRMLYQLSLQINENFRQKFCQLYYDQTYWGRLSRQLLCPPLTIYKYDKTKPGSPRVSMELPPRVSLRYFASYHFWTYLMIGWIVAVTLGYGLPVYLLFAFFIVLLYKCIRAIASNPVRHNYPTEGFGNISFDDSF
ncbi:sphingomyelin phosphodiesterase 4 [Tribolium castaneum]|uniref:sphingomyelin phosphodiesterase 4 n=1 Tax=Tribolium castaneum TaxID=7070 RepID=UPI00046C001C|nr:PREDICTED: sphingomyelin phosphodiesterase 4 [Tribolium castaneum]|eukprot:XP_008197945.1 PREDICTED: sphingomyelin phosphodiesterase 4 [Tribolium castaneum]